VCDWWTQGEIRVMDGVVGERSSGWEERRFSAKCVPAEWETMEMWEMWRWVRSKGIVSRNTGIL
jgi:hypothetical protein